MNSECRPLRDDEVILLQVGQFIYIRASHLMFSFVNTKHVMYALEYKRGDPLLRSDPLLQGTYDSSRGDCSSIQRFLA